MAKQSFEAGQLVAHRTAPDVTWVALAGVDAGVIAVRRVRDDGAVQDAEFFAAELVPYTDEPLAVAGRLSDLIRGGHFSQRLAAAADELHDDIADELDAD